MAERKHYLVRFKVKPARARRDVDKTVLFKETMAKAGAWGGASFLSARQLRRESGTGGGDRVVLDFDSPEVPALATELDDAEADALRRHPDVEEVEEDQWAHASTASSLGVGLNSDGRARLLEEGGFAAAASPETLPWGISAVDAMRAWSTSMGGGIRVAVIDTGIDPRHPDLVANIRPGKSFVPQSPEPDDDNGHGTHCAGTIAAAWNGAGVVGVAPAAELLPVKVLDQQGSGLFGWIGAGVEWAVQAGADILSLSLGGGAMPNTVQAVFAAAHNAGKLIIAAAGNEAGPVGFPAKLPSCMAVSAVDRMLALASFSNRGDEVEICAPGVDVLSTAPGGGYRTLSGTSMACPHVSGVAALAWAAHRFSTNRDIRELLKRTAGRVPGPASSFGAGLVNALRAARARA